MKKYLVIYSTTDGQTKKICEKIVSSVHKENSYEIYSLEKVFKIDLDCYDKIIIGASIRYGKHKPQLYEFIKKNKKILEKKFTAFFTVNVVARKENKNTPNTNPYMKKFLNLSSWQPNELSVFAGKIDYPKYSFFDRQIIRLIMYITKGPTDTSNTYEFTDWDEVEKFANKIL